MHQSSHLVILICLYLKSVHSSYTKLYHQLAVKGRRYFRNSSVLALVDRHFRANLMARAHTNTHSSSYLHGSAISAT